MKVQLRSITLEPLESKPAHSDVRYFPRQPGKRLANGELWEAYARNWLWRAVSALVERPQPTPSPREMGELLKVSTDEIYESLEALQELGLLQYDGRNWTKPDPNLVLNDHQLSQESVLEAHALISNHLMTELDPNEPDNQGFYRTSFVIKSPESMRAFCHRLDALLREFDAEDEADSSSQVYGMAFTSVKLTKTREQKPGRHS